MQTKMEGGFNDLQIISLAHFYRTTMLAWYMLSSCVCVFVFLFVTLQYCITRGYNKRLCYGRGTTRRTCQQKFCNYKISLLYGIICVILRLAIFTQYRSVTDTHTHTERRTDRYPSTACTALAQRRAVKIDHIARVPQSIITMQATSIGSQQIVRQTKKCRLSTYLNDNAHTPLGRFVVYMLCKHVFNKHGEKSNRWSLCLSLSQLERGPSNATQTDRWSVVVIIDPRLPASSLRWRNFF